MSAELEAKSLGPAEEAALLQALEATPTCGDPGKVPNGSAALDSCDFNSKEVPAEEHRSTGQVGNFCGQGEEIDRKADIVSGGSDELLAPNQLLAAGIGDLAVKDDISEGAVAMEMPAAPADVELDTALSVKEESRVGKEEHESSDEESENSEEESSEASSSSDDEEEESKEDEESSEASSSSDDEQLGAKKHGGAGGAKGDSMEALLEEGELMIGSDDEDVPKGPIKSKNEAEVSSCCFIL